MSVTWPMGIAEKFGQGTSAEVARLLAKAKQNVERGAQGAQEVIVEIIDTRHIDIKVLQRGIPAKQMKGLTGHIQTPDKEMLRLAQDKNLKAVATIRHPSQRYLDFDRRQANLLAFHQKSPMTTRQYKRRLLEMGREAMNDLFPLTRLADYWTTRDWVCHLYRQARMPEAEYLQFRIKLMDQAIDLVMKDSRLSYDAKRGWLANLYNAEPMGDNRYRHLTRTLMRQAMATAGI